jgi:D-glycero-alpha-D-manno-heptose-7-phosphate kinase
LTIQGPLFIAKTPLRVSFIGGGSDYPEYFKNHGGAVIGASINQFVYTNLLPLNDYSSENIRFTYRITESVESASELKHPVVKAVLQTMKPNGKLNIGTMSDLPGGTGLGSSSAFTVGLIQLMAENLGLRYSPEELAVSAIKIEREILSEPGGHQDQYFSAYGGLNLISFSKSETQVKRLISNPEVLRAISSHIALVPIEKDRSSSEFARQTVAYVTKKDNLKSLESDLNFTLDLAEKISSASEILEIVKFLSMAVNRSWESKKKIYSANKQKAFERTERLLIENGATGFKLCGAGASGFFLAIFEDPDRLLNTYLANKDNWILPKIQMSGSELIQL